MKNFKEKADLIWRVADLLRGDYKQSDYGKVILPMTVLRRLDCVLEQTKLKVLDYLPKVDSLKESAKDIALNKIAGFNFHNRSQFNFDKLIADPNNVSVRPVKIFFYNDLYLAHDIDVGSKFLKKEEKIERFN
jgi:type I restriction enzyme M protein